MQPTTNLSQPKRRYFSDDCGLDTCPECGKPIVKANCTILVEAKAERDQGNFITSTWGSHFCETCPVVVFDVDEVNKAAISVFQGAKSLKYIIAGIVDMDAIPADKKDLEIGTDTNPVPLVKFLPDIRKPNFPEAPAIKAPERNDPCVCGSGKKYKKCCGKEN